MEFDMCTLSKIVGDINFHDGVRKFKDGYSEGCFIDLYFAKAFYTFCEDVNGIKKCREIMNVLEEEVKGIQIEMKEEGFEPMDYVRDYLDILSKYLSKETIEKLTK